MFYKTSTKLQLTLPPCAKNETCQDLIKKQLNQLLLKPSDELDGIIMSYTYTLESNIGVLLPDTPFVLCPVQVEFLVFKPEATCKGIVNQVSSQHIGCLLNGILNASILVQDIQNYEWDEDRKGWKGKDFIKVGSTIHFNNLGIQVKSDGSLFLKGQIY